MDDYYDLGTQSRPVTTTVPAAQVWFDRGLTWYYGFNHEEAVRCFRKAAGHDAACAMAYWGLASALGSEYNKRWEDFTEAELQQAVPAARAATDAALARLDRASPVEQALIRALDARYQSSAVPGLDALRAWNDAYADAMRQVHAAHPDDDDVCALFAEAMINRTPWQLWDLAAGRPAPGADTLEAQDVLERALGGHYHAALAANERAVRADRTFLAREGPLNFYTLSRTHDYHFKLYAAMFLGQLRPALDAADELVATMPDDLLRVTTPPMADWLEGFVAMRVHVLVRFGRWQAILDEPLPDDPVLYCVTTALRRYAKGVAHAALGNVAAAEAEQHEFLEAAARVPGTRKIFNNTCRDILAIAAAMLDGEIAYRKGDYDGAFMHLRRAVTLDDSLPYDEPWGWMQPARHALGALLLEQGRVEDALEIYRADLGLDGTLSRAHQHPDNVWSLHGYVECLHRLGRHADAASAQARLDLALARADPGIGASCFCRVGAPDGAKSCCE